MARTPDGTVPIRVAHKGELDVVHTYCPGVLECHLAHLDLSGPATYPCWIYLPAAVRAVRAYRRRLARWLPRTPGGD